MLYTFHQPYFIADAYARRLFEKLQAPISLKYHTVKPFAEENGQLSVEQWGAVHGWIVRFAQNHLKARQI